MTDVALVALLAAGSVLSVLGLSLCALESASRCGRVRVRGVVTEVERVGRRGRDADAYRAVVAYEDGSGRAHAVRARVASTRPLHGIGDEVVAWVVPGDDDVSAVVEGEPRVLGLAGVAFACAGVVLLALRFALPHLACA